MTRTQVKSLVAGAVFSTGLFCGGAVCAQTTQTTQEQRRQQAQQEIQQRMDVLVRRNNEAVAAIEAAQQLKIAAASDRATLAGLSAVLVSGDLQPSAVGTGDDIPAAARKALADMKDFLPYKSYRLLDAAWFAGGGDSNGQLRGADGRVYSLRLKSIGTVQRTNQPVSLSVELEELAGGARATESQMEANGVLVLLLRQQFELRKERTALLERYVDRHPDVMEVNRRIAETTRQIDEIEAARVAATRGDSFGRPIVDTSFTINIGETVVVGTSRVNGDKALILLLTAVPK